MNEAVMPFTGRKIPVSGEVVVVNGKPDGYSINTYGYMTKRDADARLRVCTICGGVHLHDHFKEKDVAIDRTESGVETRYWVCVYCAADMEKALRYRHIRMMEWCPLCQKERQMDVILDGAQTTFSWAEAGHDHPVTKGAE